MRILIYTRVVLYIQRGAPISICDATSSEIAFPTKMVKRTKVKVEKKKKKTKKLKNGAEGGRRRAKGRAIPYGLDEDDLETSESEETEVEPEEDTSLETGISKLANST